MTRTEIADLQSLTREFRDYKEITNTKLESIETSLEKMLPTKAVITAGKIMAWFVTTSVALLAIFTYSRHK